MVTAYETLILVTAIVFATTFATEAHYVPITFVILLDIGRYI